MEWQGKLRKARRPAATRVSRNGQIVLSARTREAVGIEPGDLVAVVPLAPGTIVIERVSGAQPLTLRHQYGLDANPLRGVWGVDPDFWIDELRNRWRGSHTGS